PSAEGGLSVSKDAPTKFKYTWSIKKDVDQTLVKQSSAGDVTFNYTVTVTNLGASGWQVSGTITLNNSSGSDITGLKVTDTIDYSGICTVSPDGANGTTNLDGSLSNVTVPSVS